MITTGQIFPHFTRGVQQLSRAVHSCPTRANCIKNARKHEHFGMLKQRDADFFRGCPPPCNPFLDNI